ncbi:hypothetical protein QFC20_001222 [Naganishia adeliensis]|uniref:Uncharacterized protein n=1 Tax=Naganishia adeliensis TaxID=92952 RepID=A0ACC2WVL3_9TREE|nr:hypothetical protein QFC20_001222 [Naganishia adeliensis]
MTQKPMKRFRRLERHADKRAAYDRYGPDTGNRPGPSGFGGGGGGMHPDDIFEQMFGFGGGFSFDMGGGGGGGRAPPRQSRDTEIEYDLTLEEAFVGKNVTLAMERDRTCGQCQGSGAKNGAVKRDCGKCAGKGFVMAQTMLAPGIVGNAKRPCPTCDGEGKKVRDKDHCKKCQGKKITKQKTKLKLNIEPGSIDGDRMVLTGEGDAMPNLPPGDVILRLRVRPHHAFHAGPPGSRDLYYTASITLSESLLGFQRVLFYHLDGRGIKVDCPTGERIIKHGDTFFIKGEGMPKNASTRNRAGDLYVRFEVEMPDLDWVKRQQAQSGPEAIHVALPGKKVDQAIPEDTVTVVKLKECPSGKTFYDEKDARSRTNHGGRDSYDSDAEYGDPHGASAQCAQQ